MAARKPQLSGIVHRWIPPLRDAEARARAAPRRWTVIFVPYSVLRQYFYVLPYEDVSGQGFQRRQSESHVRKLRKAMAVDDRYTPSTFYGGLNPSHEKSLRIAKAEIDGEVYEKVTIFPTEADKIPLIDGNHRDGSLSLEWEDARAAGDTERMRIIEEEVIPVHLFLDSQHLRTDFMNLQKGLAMDRDLLKSLEQATDQVDPAKRPYADFAKRVCHLLNKDPASHLFRQVKFDTLSSYPIHYSAITDSSGSNLGTSIYGGALVAKACHREAEWLAATYAEAWDAISRDEESPAVRPGAMLRPVILGGTRGASAFITGIGNMLAWRKAHARLEAITPEERGHLIEVVDGMYADRAPIGWSATDKRGELGLFARAYFADLVDGGLDDFQGIPRGLLDLFAPSTFMLDTAAYKEILKKQKKAIALDADIEAASQSPVAAKQKVSKRAKTALLEAKGLQA